MVVTAPLLMAVVPVVVTLSEPSTPLVAPPTAPPKVALPAPSVIVNVLAALAILLTVLENITPPPEVVVVILLFNTTGPV